MRKFSALVSTNPKFRKRCINMVIRGRVVPTISDNSSCEILCSMQMSQVSLQMSQASFLPSLWASCKSVLPRRCSLSPSPDWRSLAVVGNPHGPDTARSLQTARPRLNRAKNLEHGFVLRPFLTMAMAVSTRAPNPERRNSPKISPACVDGQEAFSPFGREHEQLTCPLSMK